MATTNKGFNFTGMSRKEKEALKKAAQKNPELAALLNGTAASTETKTETEIDARVKKACVENAEFGKSFCKILEKLNGDDYFVADNEQLVKEMVSGELHVLAKNQERAGIKADADDEEKPWVVTYRDVSGNVLAKIDFAALYVDAEKAKAQNKAEAPKKGISFGSSGASAEVRKNYFGKKPVEKKPVPKTFGRKNTTAAETEKVVEKAEKVAPKAEKKEEAVKVPKKLSQEAYERLLIGGILAVNTEDTIMHDGLDMIKVPKCTKDGTTWKVIATNRMAWTFQAVQHPDVQVEIGVMDVQFACGGF